MGEQLPPLLPRPAGAATYLARMKTHVEFTLTGPHGRPFAIDATYRASPQPQPVVVFLHGFKGFKDWGHFGLLADFFAERDFVFIKLNLSHNGLVVGGTGDLEDLDAFARNNYCLELDDLGQLLDALHTPGATPLPAAQLDLRRLFLIGHSRGGGIVLLKAREDARVRAVATWASVADLHPRWPQEVLDGWQQAGVLHVPNVRTGQQLPLYYQIVENYLANLPRLDLPARLPGLHQPLLVVHGEADETVPLTAAYQLAKQKAEAKLLVLANATHNFGGAHPWPSTELPAPARAAAEQTAAFFAGLA